MLKLSRSEVNNYQYLFLGGILGEVLELSYVGNYLKENKQLFLISGIKHVDYKTLSSKNCAATNASELLEIIKKIHFKNKKKVVIFAHSKGTLETILAMGQGSRVFLDSVHKVILTQAPLDGAPYIPKLIGKVLKPFWPGLQSLSKSNYQKDFTNILVRNNELQDFIKNDLLMIKGYKTDFSNVSWIIKAPFLLTRMTGHMSDGLVRYQDQCFHTENYQQITLNIDHSDLFCSSRLSNLDNKSRREIFAQLLAWIANETPVTHNNMPAAVQFSTANKVLNFNRPFNDIKI